MNVGIGSVIYSKISQLFLVGQVPNKGPNKESNKESKEKIVLLGYGWAGKAFADRLNTSRYDLTVISETPAMLNTTRMKKSLQIPDRNLFRVGRQFITVDRITRVNLSQRQVHTVAAAGRPYTFDYLVVATGSEVNDFRVPGVQDHCHFFKTAEDVETLRADLRCSNVEQSIVIVGAGPTSIELAFELHSTGFKNVTLLEAQGTILPAFSPAAREKVIQELQTCGILLKLNTPVIWVESKSLKVKTGPGIAFDLAIWNAGVKPKAIPGLPPSLSVDEHLRLNDYTFAIGDISQKGSPTAQNAKQQGIYLAEAFNSNSGRSFKFEFEEKIKVLHTKDALILDFGQKAFRFPKYFARIYDFFI
jgi:NADH:ubiquinone reductase (non-electrogenic)